MEKQTKILIGLAVLGAAAYLYFRPKGAAQSTTPNKDGCEEGYIKENINCIKAPCPQGKCVKKEQPLPTAGTYVFLKDTEIKYSVPPNGEYSKIFKKGDYVDADVYPYSEGEDALLKTTVNGKKPYFGMLGQPWLTIPLNSVKKVTTNLFSTFYYDIDLNHNSIGEEDLRYPLGALD